MRWIVAVVAVCGAPLSAGAAQVIQTDNHGARATHGVLESPFDGDEEVMPRDSGWISIGPFGGNAFDVAVSTTNPNIVLAGLGQVYRSTDGGFNWSPVAIPFASIFDIAFAPDGTCYLGASNGLWKSTNNGASFTQIDMGLGLNTAAHRVTIDPNNPSRLWVGIDDHLGSQTNNVVFSPNGGSSWENRTPPLGTPMACLSIALNPLDSNKVYAAFGGAFGGGQFWYSDDGGFNWENRTNGMPNRPEKDVVSNGTDLYVTGGQLFGSQDFGLFHSIDDGQSWTPLHDGTWPIMAFEDIELVPGNNQIIYLASLGAGVYKTIDGGTSWTFNTGGTTGVSLASVRLAPGNPNRIFLGASSLAVLQSDDAGAQFDITANGISLLSLFSIDANPLNGQELAVAFQADNSGGVYTSTNGGVTWQTEALPGTRFNYVKFSPTGVLHAISNGPTTVGAEGIYRRNPGTSWTPLGPDVGSLFETDLDAICFSSEDPNLIVASGGDFGVAGFEPAIWRSTNGGTNWDRVCELVGRNGHVRDTIRVEDGNDLVLVGSLTDASGQNRGGALRSTDGGVNWVGAMHGLNPVVNGAALSASSQNPFTFYLGNQNQQSGGPPGGGLYKSADAGATWVPAGFASHVTDVLVDPLDDSIIYLANNSQRILISENAGASASSYTTGLGSNDAVRQLGYAPGSAPRLLAATTAGAYARDLAALGGDANCSGSVNFSDVSAFVLALTDPNAHQANFPGCSLLTADINNDGLVNGSDIQPFVALLVGP